MGNDRQHSKKEFITAADLMSELATDSDYQEATRSREKTRADAVERIRHETAGLIRDLNSIGYSVSSIDELRTLQREYPDAVPILLRWLPRISYLPAKEGVVRALSVPWASPEAAKPLIDEFRAVKSDDPLGIRWTIGSALEVVADDTVLDELIEIAYDVRYGRSREMVVVALGNVRDQKSADAAMSLLDDSDVYGHAIIALGRLGAKQAESRLEQFLNDERDWVRDEAAQALRKIRTR